MNCSCSSSKSPTALLLREQTIDAITTNETSFNRDGHPFELLRRSILPELANRLIERRAAKRLSQTKARIWSAAASSGQEAYSVAMAVADFLAARSTPGLILDDFPILASDISSPALSAARAGTIFTVGARPRPDRRSEGATTFDRKTKPGRSMPRCAASSNFGGSTLSSHCPTWEPLT